MIRLAAILSPVSRSVLVLALLASCGDREVILPGERLDPRAVTTPDGPAVVGPAAPTTAALTLPAARTNAAWPSRAGAPDHVSGHVTLGAGTQMLWAAPVGSAAGKRHRITADPVVAEGRVFTLDAETGATATGLDGRTLWRTDLIPAGESRGSVSGGGVAYADGRVFVTTGYGELVALSAANGAVLWRQRANAPIGGAPTAVDGMVYVTDRSSTGWAIRAEDGKVQWQTSGITAHAGWMGVSSPAVQGDLVVFPFASGDVMAVDRATGDTRWSGQVAGTRIGRSIGYVRDVTGDPVITGDLVIAGTSSGRIDAFDRETGVPAWSVRDGAMNPVLAAGNAVFAVTDDSRLVRLDRANGGQVWSVSLPEFTDARVKKRDRVHAHFGPILAGGKLVLASSDGVMRMFDPASGVLVGQAEIPGGAATAPVVAQGIMFVTGRDGRLFAYK